MDTALIYIRVSTREQAEEGYSIGEQEERLKKYCDAMNWNIGGIFIDPGFSGANINRPALQKMIKEIERGNGNIVLVDKLDRLSRSQYDTLFLINKVFSAHNCSFVSRAEAFDTSTPFGRAMVGILSVFAELERERIKERMSDGREGRAKEGKYRGGGHVPIGYDYDPKSGALKVNDYEAAQVKEIFALFNSRCSPIQIAEILNQKGYTAKGTPWSYWKVRRCVENRTYIGKLKHNDNWYEGAHEAIVTEAEFDQAQSVLAEYREKNSAMGHRRTTALGGLVYCGNCGAKYHSVKAGANKYAYYICYSRSKSSYQKVNDPNCKNKTYRMADLENLVYSQIRDLKANKGYLSMLRSTVDSASQYDAILSRIKEVEKKIERYMDLYALGGIELSSIKSKIDPLMEEKKKLEAELEAKAEEKKSNATKEEIIGIIENLDQILSKNDPGQTHAALSILINKIVVNDDQVDVYWNFTKS